jgi:hypothetical protein
MLITLITKAIKKRKAGKDDPEAVSSEPPCAHGVSVPTPCDECKATNRAARVYRARLIAGLVLPFALQALDTTL